MKKGYTKIFFTKIVMTRIRKYSPLKLKRGIFGFKKRKWIVLLYTVKSFIGIYYPNKNWK